MAETKRRLVFTRDVEVESRPFKKGDVAGEVVRIKRKFKVNDPETLEDKIVEKEVDAIVVKHEHLDRGLIEARIRTGVIAEVTEDQPAPARSAAKNKTDSD